MAFRFSTGGSEVVANPEIVFRTDVSDVIERLSEVVGAADKAAQGSAASFTSGFNKISAAGAAATAQLGGSFGRIGAVANSVVRPLIEVSGALGIIGAGAATLGATAFAMRGIADAALSAATDLDKLGIEYSHKSEIESYKAATKDLHIAFEELETSVGGELAGDLAKVAGAAVEAIHAFEDLASFVSQDREEIELFARAGLAIATLGLTEAARAGLDYAAAQHQSAVNTAGLTEKEQLEKEAKEDVIEGTRQQKLADDAAALALKKLREETEKQATAEREAVQAQEKHRAATAELETVYASLHKTQLGPREQIQADLDEQLRKITELGEKSGDYEAAQQAAQAAADAAAAKTHALDVAQAKMFADAQRGWADLTAQVRQSSSSATTAMEHASKAISKGLRDWYVNQAEVTAQAVGNIAGNFADLESSIVSGYQARIDAGEHLSVAQVTQANKAINAAEEAQIAQAGITAAITAATGIATLQEAGVPAPIAIPLGIAEGAGLFAATVAGIRQHRPVNFAYNAGGDPVHTNQVTTDAADQGIATKGGSVPDSGDDHGVGMGPRNGQAPGNKGGSTDRTREGGSTLGLTPEAARVLRTVHRAGKRDFRGHR